MNLEILLLQKEKNMKGISYITDEKNKKKTAPKKGAGVFRRLAPKRDYRPKFVFIPGCRDVRP